MLCVPADPGGQRTVLIVLVHGGEMAPLGIAARDFGDAGFEVNAKPLPKKKKNAGAHGRTICREAGTKPRRREKERDKAGFEEHAVGLVAGKIGCGTDEGDKANETKEQHAAGKNVDGEKDRSDEAGPANDHQHMIAGREPKQRGRVPETREADGIGDRAQVFGGRENSVGTNEAANLEEQREKSREIDRAESAEEEPAEDGSETEIHGAVPIYRVRRQAPVSSSLLAESNFT